jgi:hypothetical protein
MVGSDTTIGHLRADPAVRSLAFAILTRWEMSWARVIRKDSPQRTQRAPRRFVGTSIMRPNMRAFLVEIFGDDEEIIQRNALKKR